MMERIGPYRVEEQIGVGGMGEVYKAFDDRLDRWVAIKRIRNDKEQADENRQRFQREARATARLSHASIVHLYDIFRDGENDCIVMEFVEGVTLDKLIKTGPLEPVQVATLGHEIADGLAAAHASEIIHRDLKVENVIVTPEGHAKILDFGLARPLLSNELDASLTGKGQLVGTSRAMSPEYVGGEAIDHRSDLFSFGVLLYEAVTGHSPFKAHNTLATLKQVMLHRQTPAHLVNANVPEVLSELIERLLAKDPEDRPQDAKEVARELGQISGNLSSGGVSRPTLDVTFSATPTEVLPSSVTSAEAWPRRRWLVVAALLLAGIAGTYFLTRWLSGPLPDIPIEGASGDPVVEQKERIVLADFQNLTGEPLLDDSIELVFRVGLTQSKHAHVLPKPQVRNALLRMERDADTPIDREVGIEIGQREAAKALVIGTIGKIGETYSVTAEVIRPETGVTTFSTQKNASNRDAILTLLEAITNAIRVHLGESLIAIEENQRPLEKVTTHDLEALKAYSLGVEAFTARQFEAALQLLKRAIEIDPEFAMAYAKLANVYISLDFADARILETLDRALSLSDRLTDFERLYVEGWAARLHGEPEKVIRTWSLMSTLYPEEVAGHFNLGMTSKIYLEDYDAAAEAFEQAIRAAAPEILLEALIQLGYCQIALERYDEARSSFERLTDERQRLALFDLSITTKSYPELETTLEEFTANPPRSAAEGRLLWAQYYADVGDYRSALREARLAENLAVKEGSEISRLDSLMAIAVLHRQLGADLELERALAAVVEAAKELMSTKQGRGDLSPVKELAMAGKLAARSGDVESAASIEALIPPLVEGTPILAWRAYLLMLRGELLAARGESPAAVAHFEDALALVDSFQIHESLAHSYETEGLLDAAITQTQWLIQHRGRGIIECLDLCAPMNVMDWSSAMYRLGVLYEQTGNPEAAADQYRRALEHWGRDEAADQGFRPEVERRLKRIEAPPEP